MTDTKQRNLEGYGLKIKKYRKAAGMTAEDLAGALQVTVSSVRNWECGLSRPDPEYLRRMFSVLNVDPNEFFGIRGVGAALTEQERSVVASYRAMDPRGREDFAALGRALAARCHARTLQSVLDRITAVPDYGRFAAAGAGSGWSQGAEAEEVLLYRGGPVSEADEVITVSGRSMEPAYHDRDRILVRRCADMEYGKVYVFSLRGTGLVVKEAAPGRLHSRNAEYGDIIPWEEDGAELIGRVVGVIDPGMVPTTEEISLYQEARAAKTGSGSPLPGIL